MNKDVVKLLRKFCKNVNNNYFTYINPYICKIMYDNYLKRLFTGSEIEVNMLQERLKDNGILSIVKNEHKNPSSSGFSRSNPDTADIYVYENDITFAQRVVADLELA